ncbi:MAG: isocitrate/isopropylmalate dehydrogenase family protein, partial [Eubacterium aggregans]
MGNNYSVEIEAAKNHFVQIIEEQFARIQKMKEEKDFVDFANKDHIVIGVCGGDGIGPFITAEG